MPDFLRWRWMPCIGLVLGSLLYVGLVVSALPLELSDKRADSVVRLTGARLNSEGSTSVETPETEENESAAHSSPRAARASSNTESKDLRGLGRRGFSPPLERPESPPEPEPPSVPEPPPVPVAPPPTVPPSVPPLPSGVVAPTPGVGNAMQPPTVPIPIAPPGGPPGPRPTEIVLAPDAGVVPGPVTPPNAPDLPTGPGGANVNQPDGGASHENAQPDAGAPGSR